MRSEQTDDWLRQVLGVPKAVLTTTARARPASAPGNSAGQPAVVPARTTELYDKASDSSEDEIAGNPAQPLDDHNKAWWDDDTPPPQKPDPTIVSHKDETFGVAADTVDTFLERAAAHFDGKEGGHCAIDFDTSPEIKDGKCVRAGVKVTIKITRPKWSGGRPPSDDHEKAIRKAETFIAEHEGRHRQIAIDVATQIVKDAVGKTQDEAERILKQIGDRSEKAQKALDGKEGMIKSINNGTDIEVGPAKS